MRIRQTIFAVVVGLVSVAFTANANPLTWTFSNVTLVDGGSITGSFTFNADTNTYSDLDIITSGLTDLADGTFTSTNRAWPTDDYLLVAFTSPSPTAASQLALTFIFASPLTDAGGVISFSKNYFYLSGAGTCTGIPGDVCNKIYWAPTDLISGGVVYTPEPSTLALLAAGIALVGFRKLTTVFRN